MTVEVVKFAFIAGEISPTLFGRTDLTKYDLAMAQALNFFVDYRGGLSSKPGTEFCDFVKRDDLNTRYFSFSFSPDLSNTYVLLFGHNYIRFLQDGAYVLSSPKVITGVTQAAAAVVTSASHGLANGTWLKISGVVGMTELNGRTWEVANVTTHTFQLKSLPDGTILNSVGFDAYVSGGSAAPIYEVVSPYASSDLAGLSVFQYRDLLRITSHDFPVYNLIRVDHDNWSMALEDISPSLDGPDIISGSATTGDENDSEVVFAVTQVDINGDESIAGNFYKLENVVNYTAEIGSVTIAWNPEPTAIRYNVYRSIVAQLNIFSGSQLGFVGSTAGTNFTDPNITPDFSRSPPVKNNPFAPGAIEEIVVTAPGSGYTDFSATISITDPTGTGFQGRAVVNESGEIVNVVIENPGKNYSAPVAVFAAGTGATATVTTAPLTGTYPALSCIFQQRQIYASSLAQPITIWGSRYKRFSNYDTSELVLADDSFEFDLDSNAVAPIRHLLASRGGLLVFTQENIWLLNGGAQGAALTPTNALAEPQTYLGISTLPPLPISGDILFTEGKGYACRLLSYNEIARAYGGDDKSIMANHLFGPGKEIISWAYQESPFKVVWAVRADGYLLAFTIVKSEEVFAWTPCNTQGKYLDVISVREGQTDRVYVTTQRFINGRWTKFVERMSLREFTNVEDAWCVDAGLALGASYPQHIMEYIVDGILGPVVTTSGDAFTVGNLGWVVRGGQGIFRITEIVSPRVAKVDTYVEPTNFIPQGENTQTFPMFPDSWTMDEPVSTLGGLWHLEGEEVSILADGNVFAPRVVQEGQVDLGEEVTRAIIGLSYECQAQSLPIIVPNAGIEARRKRIVGLAARLDKSRGLKYGRALDNLYEMRERTTEPYGQPTRLVNGIKYQFISTNWDENGQTYFVLSDPVPVTILSIVFDMEVGDEPD